MQRLTLPALFEKKKLEINFFCGAILSNIRDLSKHDDDGSENVI